MNLKYNREEILDKGIELLSVKGYTATGTQELIDKIGIPRGSFYNFFKDKEEFAIKVTERYVNWGAEVISSFLTNTSIAPLERIEAFFKNRTTAYGKKKFKVGCLLASITSELAGINSNIVKASKMGYIKWAKVFEVCIKEGQETGDVRNDYNSEELADLIISNYNGAMIMMKANENGSSLNLFLKTTIEFLRK